MSDEAEVLFANEAFYLAFCGRDLAAMEALWARRAAVSCIHPGWHALHSRDEVMDSWRAILANPDSPRIACCGARAMIVGEIGIVVCYGENLLVATNLFLREEGAWRMLHHQAGPCPEPPAGLEEPEAGPLQ